MSLGNSDEPVEHYKCPKIWLQISKCICKLLFITTYIGIPHCRVTLLARVPHTLVVLLKSQFSIRIRDEEHLNDRKFKFHNGSK